MIINQSIRIFNNPVERSGGADWYRLHAERENVCEALLKEYRPSLENQPPLGLSQEDITRAENWHRDLLEARLRKIDDALDRLMAGSYGDCSRCGRWIEDTKLDFDPAVAFCIFCWERIQTQH
jgi:RNA polymerase-binding transcription factor DksA